MIWEYPVWSDMELWACQNKAHRVLYKRQLTRDSCNNPPRIIKVLVFQESQEYRLPERQQHDRGSFGFSGVGRFIIGIMRGGGGSMRAPLGSHSRSGVVSNWVVVPRIRKPYYYLRYAQICSPKPPTRSVTTTQ